MKVLIRMSILIAAIISLLSCKDEKNNKDAKINELENKISSLEEKLEEQKSSSEQSSYYPNEINQVKDSLQINSHFTQTKYVFGIAKIKSITTLIGTKKRLIPDDPNSPYGSDESYTNEYSLVTSIELIKDYNENKKYQFKDETREAALREKKGINLLTSYEVKEIQIYEFDDYSTASKSREKFNINDEIKIYKIF